MKEPLGQRSPTIQSNQSQAPIFPSEPRRFFPRSVWSIDFWRYAYDDARVVPLRVFAPAPPRLVFPAPARSIPTIARFKIHVVKFTLNLTVVNVSLVFLFALFIWLRVVYQV